MNTGRLRLMSLREQTEARGVDMMTEAGRFDLIRGAEPTAAVQADQLFQTPEPLARRAAEMLAERLPAGASWLEPSAGLGRLYRAGRAAGLTGYCTLVEREPQCARELYRATEGDEVARLLVQDFLGMSPGYPRFGGVLMNPPFRRGMDIRHIRHAISMVEPDGWVVGFCYCGVKQQRELMHHCDTWEVLPRGSFRSEGTDAGVALYSILVP